MNGVKDMAAPVGVSKSADPRKAGWLNYSLRGIVALAAWWLIYHSLAPMAGWFTYSLCGLAKGSHLGATVEFLSLNPPRC